MYGALEESSLPEPDEEHTDIYGRPKYREGATWAQLMRLMQFLGPQMGLAAGATCFQVIGTVLSLIAPQYTGGLFDAIVNIRTDCIFLRLSDCDVEATMRPLIWITVFSLSGMVISNTGSFLFSLAGRRVIARTRKELFHAYLHQDMFFFDVKGVGELLSRIGPDVSQIEGVVTAFASLLTAVIKLTGSLVFMMTISDVLTGVTVAAFPVWALTAYVGGRIIARLSFALSNLLADQAGYATDILGMISTVRAFGREHRELDIFGTFTERVYRLAVKNFVTQQALGAIDGLISLLISIIVLWLGARAVVNQSLSLGQLVAFQQYSSMANASFNSLSGLYAGLVALIGGSQVIVALLDSFKLQDKIRARMPPIIGQQIGVEARGRVRGKIARVPSESLDLFLQNVNFAYPSRPTVPVLNDFSLRLRANQMTALVGPSGVGKSSILSLLLRYYEPNAGTVMYGDTNIADYDIRTWRLSLALVTQEPVLLSGTVAENIGYGMEMPDEAQIHAAAAAAGATEFIERLANGFETPLGINASGQKLSGGQKQRIAIARAIARNPRVLLLDEPTSALDRENERLISATVERMRSGRIVVMITHHLDIIKQSDNIVVMLRGGVAEQGRHESLIAQRGAYYEFYRNTAAMSQGRNSPPPELDDL